MTVLVPPPPTLPAGAGNLLAAAFTPNTPLERVGTPVGYRARARGGWQLVDPQCAAGEPVVDEHDADEQGELVQAYPFTIQVWDECTTGWEASEYEQRARDRLRAVESAAVAHELWTGALARAAGRDDDPTLWLADEALVEDLTPAGGAVKPAVAEALLEGWLGDTLAGPPGVIHATREAGTLLPVQSVEGQVLTTRFGTRIAADAGYPGTGPDGDPAADGESWAYASARPMVLFGPVYVHDFASSINRAVNTVRLHAEREAVVLIPRAVAAVRTLITA